MLELTLSLLAGLASAPPNSSTTIDPMTTASPSTATTSTAPAPPPSADRSPPVDIAEPQTPTITAPATPLDPSSPSPVPTAISQPSASRSATSTNTTSTSGAATSQPASADDPLTVTAPATPAAEVSPPSGAQAPPPPLRAPALRPEFTVGVHAFLRGQTRINPDLGRGNAQNITEVLQRVRLTGAAKLKVVSAFVQLQDNRTWGFEPSPTTPTGNTDLHQGYFQLEGGTPSRRVHGYLRAGRQEITYGRQRLIGALGWAPTGLSLDAIRAHGEVGWFSADAFAAILAPMGTVSQPAADPADPPETATSNGSQLFAVLLAAKPHAAIGAELLGLFKVEDGTNGAIFARRTIDNFGLRLFGVPHSGFDYDAEFNFQVGEVDDLDHQAWAGAANIDYLMPTGRVRAGGGIGYAIASGQACSGASGTACGNGESTEFYNFYPTNHGIYGMVDLFGWRNMRDLEVSAKLVLPDQMQLRMQYHFFQLHEPTGRWSNAGGSNVGVGWDPDNTEHTLGHEIELFVHLTPFAHFSVEPGYGVFFPTQAGVTLGGPEPQHFGYLWAIADF